MQKPKKLKSKQVAPLREELLARQRSICLICGEKIHEGEAVLDHDHDTGFVRGVLHRNCNQIEGRVKSWCKRNGKGVDFRTVLRNILLYWDKDYSGNPVHPTHKTEKEKEISRLKKRMSKLKTDSAKKKYKERIKELSE